MYYESYPLKEMFQLQPKINTLREESLASFLAIRESLNTRKIV